MGVHSYIMCHDCGVVRELSCQSIPNKLRIGEYENRENLWNNRYAFARIEQTLIEVTKFINEHGDHAVFIQTYPCAGDWKEFYPYYQEVRGLHRSPTFKTS